MSDSKQFDKYLQDVDEVGRLENIFNELLKSNISILGPKEFKELSDYALEMLNLEEHNETQVRIMKLLLMICNVLYNRSDLLVLPVEDGVYDLLLELYKKYDSHFQVGSAVVQFKNQVEEAHPEVKQIVRPFIMLPKVERDEMRQQVFNRLSEFDHPKLNSRDMIVSPFIFENEERYVSKREHNTAHNHPQLVGTLDKCKFVLDKDALDMGVYNDSNVKILERDFFQKHIAAGIIRPDQDIEMVLELKYDGISIEADCSTEVISARSRGDTGAGVASDMTPILQGYKFYQNKFIGMEPIGVKFEAIMTKPNLDKFNELRGTTYANCRTAIVGLFGASDGYKFRDLITLVPLAVDRDQVPQLQNRIEEIEFANNLFRRNGEPLRYMYIHGTVTELLWQIKKFADEAYAFRDYVEFMFDGIVVSYLDEGIRAKLGRENFINKYSMAVKFNPETKLTQFNEYTFEVGQDGRICPMIHYNPVEFFGTIHTKSTGSSLARFNELALKPGDIIKVTYVNDVMPYVEAIDCEHNRNNPNPLWEFPKVCPDCGTPLIISDTGKTALCPNMDCPSKVIGRLTNMLQKMNIKGFAESTIATLGVKNFYDLVHLNYEQIALAIGPGNASNFMDCIDQIKRGSMLDYVLIGSLGFTGCAAQTWKTIFMEISLPTLVQKIEEDPVDTEIKLSWIKGIGPKTAHTIIEEYPYYARDIKFILEETNYMDSYEANIGYRPQVRFSGVRDLQLAQQLCNLGFDADGNSGITKNTEILIIPYAGFESNKTKKVSKDCKLIPIDEMRQKVILLEQQKAAESASIESDIIDTTCIEVKD